MHILEEILEYLGIAFVSSALLIIMSKIILQKILRRPAEYYDAEELKQEELMLDAAGLGIGAEHETGPDGVPLMDLYSQDAEKSEARIRRERRAANRRRRLEAFLKYRRRSAEEAKNNDDTKDTEPVNDEICEAAADTVHAHVENRLPSGEDELTADKDPEAVTDTEEAEEGGDGQTTPDTAAEEAPDTDDIRRQLQQAYFMMNADKENGEVSEPTENAAKDLAEK